jgi:hypothetical protein
VNDEGQKHKKLNKITPFRNPVASKLPPTIFPQPACSHDHPSKKHKHFSVRI